MTTIVYWEYHGHINCMTEDDYWSRDKQEQLTEKYRRQGTVKKPTTMEQARNKARKKVPDPTIITFVVDPTAPLSSKNGAYGHAGRRDLFDRLIELSGREHIHKVMKLRNAGEWNVPSPTIEDIQKVFGPEPEVLEKYLDYRRHHGLR